MKSEFIAPSTRSAQLTQLGTSSYRLCPKGSFSTIEKLSGDRATFELYGSGEWQIGRLLHSRRFDHGMVAFLECLRQLAAWACARDAELRLPHA